MKTLQEIDTILTYLEFVVKKQQSIFNEYDDKALRFINLLRNLLRTTIQHELELFVKLYKKETK